MTKQIATTRNGIDSFKKGDGIFSVMNVDVITIECRELIDTGAGSLNAFAKLIDLLKMKPVEVKVKPVDMLLRTALTRLGMFQSYVQSVFVETSTWM